MLQVLRIFLLSTPLFVWESLSAAEVSNLTLQAGATVQQAGGLEFVGTGEPVVAAGSGPLVGLGFGYTVPPKVSTLKFVDTPAIAPAGAGVRLAAVAVDSHGRPVRNVSVQFSRLSGAGTLDVSSVRTGPDGIAAVIYQTTGSAINVIEAKVPNLSPVSKRVLSLSVPKGTLTGLPTTDDGEQPHVLSLGNKNNISSAGGNWGARWSPNDVIGFASARREVNYSNGMLFPHDLKLKISVKKLVKKILSPVSLVLAPVAAIANAITSAAILIKPVAAVVGIAALAAGAIIASVPGGQLVGAAIFLGGSALTNYGLSGSKPPSDPWVPTTNPPAINYCQSGPTLSPRSYSIQSSQKTISGEIIAPQSYALVEKGYSINSSIDNLKVGLVNSGPAFSGSLPGSLSNVQISKPVTVENLGPVGGNNLITIQSSQMSKATYNIKPTATNWAEQSLGDKINVKDLATGSWGKHSLGSTLHGAVNPRISGKNQWVDAGIALANSGKALQWANANGEERYSGIDDFNPQQAPSQPAPEVSPSGGAIAGGSSQDGVFNVMSKSDGTFKSVSTFAGLTPNPVCTLTGNLAYSVEDFFLPGRSLYVQFVRFYNSLGAHKAGPLGYGWTHNYSMALEYLSSGDVRLEVGDGGAFEFTRNTDGTYSSPAGIYSRLVVEGENHVLVHKFGSRYVFDATGTLQKIVDPNNNTVSLVYSGGQLSQIVDPAGRKFLFAYDTAGRITSITGPSGKATYYGYDEKGDLINVEYPGSKRAAYSYENHLLSAYDDPKSQTGIHAGVYEYDEFGRITAEYDSEGNPIIGLEYAVSADGGSHTTLTDAKNKSWIDSYDSRGLWVSRRNPLGDETKYKWDGHLGLAELTEPDGRKTQTVRDDRGNILSLVNPDGSAIAREYDPVINKVTTEVSPMGNAYRYVYDNKGNLTSISDPENGVVRFKYDANGGLTEFTDQLGRKTAIFNDAYGNVSEVIDPEGGKRTYAYNQDGSLTATTDENGNKTDFSWSPGNELVQITYPDNTTFKMQYDPNGNLVAEEDARGAKTTYTYNNTDKIVAFTNAEGGEQSFGYDENGLMASITDPMGNTTRLIYDDVGRLTKNVDSLGAVHEIGYDKSGREASFKDPKGALWQFEYDPNGHISKMVRPDNTQILLNHDAEGKIASVESSLGNTTQFVYDRSGQLTEKIGPEGEKETFRRDSAGNVSSYVDPAGGVYSFSYNSSNELVRAEDPKGGEWALTRDGTGNITAISDPAGNTSRFSYTPMGEVSEYRDQENNAWKFTYDPEGNITSSEDPLGHKTTLKYDSLNQLTERTDPVGNSVKYAYSANGYLSQINTDAGTTLDLTYDPEGRVLTAGNSENGVRHYKYDLSGNLIEEKDLNGNIWNYAIDSLDRLTAITDPDNKAHTFEWDSAGRLLRERDRNGNTWKYDWSPSGNLVAITNPAGSVTSYSYNNLKQLTDIVDPLGGSRHMEYDPIGLLKSWTDPENRKTVYTHDSAGRLTSTTDPAGATTEYKYSKTGRMAEVVDSLGGSIKTQYDAAGNKVSVTDVLGKVTLYNYDGANRLIKTSYPDGASVANAYDANGNVVSQTDQDGKATRYSYDSLSRVVSKTTPDNHTVGFGYDQAGNRTSVVAQDGSETQYSYDAYSRLKETRDPLGNVTKNEFDNNGNFVAAIDATGARTSYEYDSSNRLIKTITPDGVTTRSVYDSVGHRIQSIDSSGNTFAYEYSASGELIGTVQPNGGKTSYAYDEAGNLVAVTDPQGNITKTEYDKLGRVIAITDAANNRTEYTLDAVGNLISVKDPLGRSESSDYDSAGRPIRSTDALNRTISYSYDVSGNRTAVTDAMGHVTRYEYDPAGRLSAVIDPLNNRISYQYDSRGNKVRETDALGRPTAYEYDASGKLIKAIDAAGGTTTFEYDAGGRKTKETGPDNRSVFYAYDAAGKLLSKADSAGNTVRYAYDGAGNLSSRTDPRNNATLFEYDSLRRLTKVTDAEGGVWRYSYDLSGRLTGITDADGRAGGFEYDMAGKLITISDALGNRTRFEYDVVGNLKKLIKPTGDITDYTYDAGNRLVNIKAVGESWNFTWDKDDLLTSFTNGDFPVSYNYDAGHRLTRTGYDKLGKALLYVYDANGNRTKLVREDNTEVLYGYDTLNRLAEINDNNRRYAFSYDQGGRPATRAYPNGVTSVYSYDQAGRLERLEHRKADGPILGRYSYTYDPNGNRNSITDGVGKYDYTYDRLDRLTRAVFPSGRRQEFTYDGAGNRTKLAQFWPEHMAIANQILGVPSSGGILETINYAYDAAGRLLTAGDKTYMHDANGRLTRVIVPPNLATTFDYDGFDRPKRISGLKDHISGAALPASEFAYAPLTPSLAFTPAPLGARVKKIDSTGVAQYVVDNTGNVLSELDGAGVRQRKYLHTLGMDEPLSITDESNHTYYMLPDGLGSVSILADSLGNPVQNYSYEPFGKPNATGRDKNPFKFTSREYDPDTQLQYNRARYYEPSLGRWLTPDPLMYSARKSLYRDTSGEASELNPFIYVGNNPSSFRDPTGLVKLQSVESLCDSGQITRCRTALTILRQLTLSDAARVEYFKNENADINRILMEGTEPGILPESLPSGVVGRYYKDTFIVELDYVLFEKRNTSNFALARTLIHELTHFADMQLSGKTRGYDWGEKMAQHVERLYFPDFPSIVMDIPMIKPRVNP